MAVTYYFATDSFISHEGCLPARKKINKYK